MPSAGQSPQNRDTGEVRMESIGHPRGTLVIVLLFGLAFGLAWFAMYVFQFLGRGAPHH
jgi:ABC-type Co2+ transport system permease subunit